MGKACLHIAEKRCKILDLEKPKKKRQAGSLKGKIWMSDDFDEPLEEFAEYM